jgi:DNA-binding XRE family transcriptional regulator
MKNDWNAKVAANRGDDWKKKLREGKMQSRMHPSIIYKTRLFKNLTQADIAKMLNVTIPTYGAIERSKRPLNEDRANKICKILNTSPQHLFKRLNDNKFIAK